MEAPDRITEHVTDPTALSLEYQPVALKLAGTIRHVLDNTPRALFHVQSVHVTYEPQHVSYVVKLSHMEDDRQAELPLRVHIEAFEQALFEDFTEPMIEYICNRERNNLLAMGKV